MSFYRRAYFYDDGYSGSSYLSFAIDASQPSGGSWSYYDYYSDGFSYGAWIDEIVIE